MSSAHQFAAEVRRAVADLPYTVVDETPEGFNMHIDIVDAQWWSVFYRNGLKDTWRWEVKVKDSGKYQITDRSATVEYQTGVDVSEGDAPRPTLRFAAKAQSGTQVSIKKRKTFAIDDEGQVGAVVDYSFDSREGKAILTKVADDLGLKRQLDLNTRIGLYVAVLTAVGLVIGFGTVGILALVG